MRFDDLFVSGVASVLGVLALGAAFSWVPAAERLRSVRAIKTRFGDSASRYVLLALAAVLFAAAGSILGGLRPPYNEPAENAYGRTAASPD